MENIPPFVLGIGVFLFGLIIGSFLNVVIYRLPHRESVVFPGSHCPACNAPIKAYDNIPVFSYVALGGKCRACRVPISPLYPAVELLVGLLYLSLFLKYGLTLTLLTDIVFVSLVVPLVFIDLRHKILPNAITYPGFPLMVLLRLLTPDSEIVRSRLWAMGLIQSPDWAVVLVGAALGAAVGGGTLWLIREAYFRLRQIEGMGPGDIKMMLFVGAYLGWSLTLLTIFVGSLLGSIIGVLLIWLRGGTMKMELPFGVFLGPAAILALFFGQRLIEWYLSLY
jgi:leader peptidase (prepilin peptidase)/N-methyltransferase